MWAERFLKLVEEYQGFEFFQAYRNDVDHILGGKGNTCWYIISQKGAVVESRIGTFQNGEWKDCCVQRKGKKTTTKDIPAGSTLQSIAEKAYLMQDERWVKGRKPRLIQDTHPHFHYVYGFGEKALDVSEKYGVTIGFSDIHDVSTGFHLRYLHTGKDVELP